ncbi:MAG TPA: DUF4388 domain-containing protein [Thermoanaerobaculia bacterium]
MLEGEIRDIDLVARLVELWREQFTGAIRFENDGIIKIIYFKGGDVLSASTNDRGDSVDEILMRANKATREHVKQALAKRKENETLGDTLLNLGFITRKELTWARRVQVVGVIRSIGEWTAGSFTIVADYLPKRDEGTIFSLPQVIVEMVVTDEDRQKFERILESGSAVFSKDPGFPEAFAKLGLNEQADAIVSEVDGARTATEVAAASGQETFNAYKLLHALSLLGLLSRIRAAVPSSEALDFENAGVADAADAWTGEMPKFDLADEPGAETATLRNPAPPVLPPLAPEPAAKEEPQWGFDEAQLEAARKATLPASSPVMAQASTPAPKPSPRPRELSGTSTTRRVPTRTVVTPVPQKKRSHFAFLVTLMTLFIIAGIAYFGFMWWNARNVSAAPIVATRRPMHKPTVATGKPPLSVTPAPVTATGPVPTPIVAATTTHATTSRATATQPTPAHATTTQAAVIPRPQSKPVTLVPAPPATDGERYAAMAREFAAAPSGKFTVQFEIVCDPSNITKALHTGGTNVWFLPISLKGRSCYRVFWGHYGTRDAAERGIREIPSTLREAKPAVVSVPQS